MKRWNMALAAFMIGLLCWMPVLQPVAAYAEVANAAAASSAASSAAPSASSDTAAQANDQSASSDASSADGSTTDAAQDSEAADASTSADGSSDSESVYSGSEFIGNSWRYDNGQLRSDLEEDGVALYSDGLPENAMGWGIDVSKSNGLIDWAKVKAAGVDFAIIRMGYGTNLDARFLNNVQGCIKNGIPFGLYLYSYAWDAASAQEEADFTVQTLKSYVKASDLAYPVFYDLEYEAKDDGSPAGVATGGIVHKITGGASTFAAMARTFANTVKAAGYTPGVYANLNWWRSYLTDPVFNSWDRWVAQYNSENTYSGSYAMWQYSSTGSVDGISGKVDLNYSYTQAKEDPTATADALAKQHAADLPDGTYTFASSSASSRVFEAKWGGTTNGTKIWLYDSNGTDSQVWKVTHDGDYVVLTNAKSGLVLDVPSGNASNGAELQLYGSNGTRAQRWIAVKKADGSYELLSAADVTKAVDLKWAATSNGTVVWLYDRNGSGAQSWKASPAQTTRDALDSLAAAHKDDTADGTYVINSSKDGTMSLTDSNSSAVIKTFIARDWQRWVISHDSQGYVTLKSLSSGKVLATKDGASGNGTKLKTVAADGSWATKWIAVKNTSGSYTFVSALGSTQVIESYNGWMKDGNPTQLYASNGTAAQQWTLTDSDGVAASLKDLAAKNKDAIKDGTYVFVNGDEANRKVLDVASGSTANGANVQIYTSNGTDAQRWKVTHDKDGFVTLTSVKSGRALEVSSGYAAPQQNVWQYDSNGTMAQKWIFIPRSDGSYQIVSALWKDLSLDVKWASTADGANVWIYTTNTSAAQGWSAFSTSGSTSVEPSEDVLETGAWGTVTSSGASGKVVDIASGSRADGANAQVYAANGTMAQLFTFEFDNGYYRVVNAKSDKALSVSAPDFVPGTTLVQRSRANDPLQLFVARKNADGTFSLLNKATGFALTISSSKLTVQRDSGSAGQHLTFAKQSYLFSEGAYTIALSGASTVFDVKNGSTASGASIQTYASNGTFAQKWFVAPVAGKDNVYTIESMNSGKRLSMDANGTVSQATISNGAEQQWKVELSGGGYAVLRNVAYSSRVLSAASGSAGAIIGSTTAISSALQRFDLQPVDAIVPNGTYIIRSSATPGQAFDVASGSAAAGANVRMWTKNDSGAQKWTFTRNSDGTYTILNARSHKSLDVQNGKGYAGANIQQWDANGTVAQCWKISYVAGGWKITSALSSSLVLDIANGTAMDGANVQLYTDNGSMAQRFTFQATSYVQEYIGFQNPSQYYQVSSNSVTIKNQGVNQFGYRTPSRIPYNATKQDCINAMITRAYDYVGTTPYIWDYSCAPGVGVDCAGLVMQALYATGMDLSPFNPWDHYYTPGHDQYANGMWNSAKFLHLSFSERQRGDLVCYPGHIAIYIGNNQIIEAASPRLGVRVSNVYYLGGIKGVLRPFV